MKIKGFTPEQMELLRRTVAKGATSDELLMFFHIAKKTGLDPFRKEIWFIKYKTGDAVIMTGRDGFLTIAQKSGEFLGIQSAAVYENDNFSIDYSTTEIKINHISKPAAKDRGQLVGAWARATRKLCIDCVEYVDFLTYKRENLWNKFPEAMIKKVCESIALKKLFGIGGIISREEMGIDEDGKSVDENEKIFEETFKMLEKITEIPKRKELIERAIATNQFNEEQKEKFLQLTINSQEEKKKPND